MDTKHLNFTVRQEKSVIERLHTMIRDLTPYVKRKKDVVSVSKLDILFEALKALKEEESKNK